MWFVIMIEKQNKETFQDLWKKEFRILPSTCDYNFELVRGNIGRQDMNLRKYVNM